MLESDKVQSSAEGKIKLREAYKNKNPKLTIAQLAEKASVSEDTIKRLLGTKECPNGVERWQVSQIAKVLEIEPTEIVDPKDWYPQQINQEFDALIQEKIRRFCGRTFVFDTFEKFLKDNPSGYFTVVGDAGMGKSAIAAKYVDKYQSPCYFNILAERRNRPELFLQSIRQQLINRYELREAKEDNLPTLLAKVSQKIPAGERLVIVVDALDEVEQEPGGNLLHLPTTLPDRVYFLLTRRPYTLETKRLFVSPGVVMKELDLRGEDYVNFSREDVKEYIRLFLYEDSEYKDGLRKWIQERHIAAELFVEQVADKSKNNFMYLRYILPTIAKGEYDDLSLRQLPDGLVNYYQNHWVRMGMQTKEMRKNAIILYLLVVAGKPITCDSIARITKRDKYEVLEVLENKDWFELLRRQQLKGETCYTIYHQSFADFLRDKPTLKRNEILLDDIQRLLSDGNDRIWEEIEEDEEEKIEEDEEEDENE
ncbi:AAA family ATPase [Argonema galeatum]|uniref:AAA family ATPase n=1 Tax=Argonema galeatum TaxID=2942762 RepID=UPI0020117FD5|nr:AAA family ATPase [Argonema galeatum]MCL1466843.1 NACHT domain-containing protein [Argonema galeatum A003/A1]